MSLPKRVVGIREAAKVSGRPARYTLLHSLTPADIVQLQSRATMGANKK